MKTISAIIFLVALQSLTTAFNQSTGSLSDSTVTTLVNTTISHCDGIVLDKNGRCFVTSWDTLSIYRFDKDFSNPPTVFYTNTISPADISYDRVHNAIVVPLMLGNSYDIVPVDNPKASR